MEKNQLHLYTIMPLDVEHIDEICEDICNQVREGVATCALFCMTLVPEGNPPVDKAGNMCAQFAKFRERLEQYGVSCGVLVQASMGHGWVLGEMFPYQKYIKFTDGQETSVVCPYDKGFHDYIFHMMQTIASHKPDCIMVDDDFRLITRPGNGCACPLHMKRFHELTGKSLSREELWESICTDSDEGRKNAAYMIETQRESLVEAAKRMRAGIDSIDPAIPGSYCVVGENAEFAEEIATILAGEGNPKVVRVNNGYYAQNGIKGITRVFIKAASQIAKMGDRVDVVLAETDTCPQNRYSTGAMSLHTHFTGSILEGVKGAKHWVTRLSAYEPESGKAYRKVLGKYHGFYEALSEMVPTLQWKGCKIPISRVPHISQSHLKDPESGWAMCVLERLGLPLYFSSEKGGVVCLDGPLDTEFTDAEILEFLHGPVFLASDTARNLIARGFGEYIGVDVRKWQGKQPVGETLLVNGTRAALQQQVQELVPLSEEVAEDSVVYHSVDGVHKESLFPGSTIYRNKLGGIVFTFCGTPQAEFTHTKAFSFLTYSRKLQLIRMLELTEELPVYYPNDEEVYFRAANMPDGGLFCSIFNLSYDVIEQLELVCYQKISSVWKLMPDGSKKELNFRSDREKYIIDTSCNGMEPVILFLY